MRVDELNTLRSDTRRFAREYLSAKAFDVDRTGQYSWEVQSELANRGYLGLHIPADLGGSGYGLVALLTMMEEIARVDASTCGILDACVLGSYAFILSQNTELKEWWLPRLAVGRSMASFALTERVSGSDPASTTSYIRRGPGGDYILNGSKCFIGNGGPSDVYAVFAKIDDPSSPRMICVAVERGDTGFKFGRREDKMGLRGTETHELRFEDCVVPPERVLSTVDDGFRLALSVLDFGRLTIGAQAIGIARGALDTALDWGSRRKAFGKTINEFDNTRLVLGKCFSAVDACAAQLYELAVECEAVGAERARREVVEFTARAAVAKLRTTELARECVNAALQFHGGYGYLKEQSIERMYRDQRVTEIYEGTSEIQRLVIGRALGSPASRGPLAHARDGDWTRESNGI